MTHKSKKSTILAIFLAILIVCGVAAGIYFYHYNSTYVTIDNVRYSKDTVSLDLSGKNIGEFDSLRKLTALEDLDLRDTGLTSQQYDSLHAALPDCRILWSVPFQEGFIDSRTNYLKITSLSSDDLSALSYLPDLTSVQAFGCRDYDVLMELISLRPDLAVSYDIDFGGSTYTNSMVSVTITDPDLQILSSNLPYALNMKTVRLKGTVPSNEEMLELKNAYPGITFIWDFEVFGIPVNSLSETLDLSGRHMTDTADVESILPYFYNLKTIDMSRCGLENETMQGLNDRNPGTRFLWTINICGLDMRTDAKYFMPVKYHVKKVHNGSLQNLRYFKDMEVIDMGHYGVSNVDFVEELPNLRYLLLCDANITDMTAIGNCTSIEFLELFMSKVTDFWPLTNLTNLRDLNLAGVPCKHLEWSHEYGPFGDYTPLLQMTWLDRLWLNYNNLSREKREALQEALPDTVLLFNHGSHTGGGFRFTPRYFTQRDIIGMDYKVG